MMGELGDLTSGEIIEQLLHVRQLGEVRNVVFMGMGEPFNNYECVVEAVRAFCDANRFALSPTRVTISTVGVVPRMLTIEKDVPGVAMALSLHAPTQELRASFVPAAKAFPLPKLMDAVDSYIAQVGQGRKLLVEYVLLANLNDAESCAHELGCLLAPRKANIILNLIPYNVTQVAHKYRPPLPSICANFQHILNTEYGVYTTVRTEMGRDIAGACGQLAVETKTRKDDTIDIEDVCGACKKGEGAANSFLNTSSPLWPNPHGLRSPQKPNDDDSMGKTKHSKPSPKLWIGKTSEETPLDFRPTKNKNEFVKRLPVTTAVAVFVLFVGLILSIYSDLGIGERIKNIQI